MVEKTTETARLKCLRCGAEAPAGDAWGEVPHPPIGSLTQCLECGSTNIHAQN